MFKAYAPNDPPPPNTQPVPQPASLKDGTTRVDPSLRSNEDGSTRELALSQTMNARNMLYHPGEVLKDELRTAAGTLALFYRQRNAEERIAMGARLFGSEGLLPKQGPDDLQRALDRVGAKNGSATDRAVVIALMGDIGALFASTGATTGVEGRTPEQSAALRTLIMRMFNVSENDVLRVQRTGGSEAVGPRKAAERSRPDPQNKPPRTGIHDLGDQADELLKIPLDQRLPHSSWAVAHLAFDRVADTEEPLVGHMSGSPAEILQVWDMLRGVESSRQFFLPEGKTVHDLPPEERDARLARAAGASGFLVALGYHSAVEVIEGTLLYTGQRIGDLVWRDQDAAHLFGVDAATKLLNEMWEANTQR